MVITHGKKVDKKRKKNMRSEVDNAVEATAGWLSNLID